MKYTNCPTCGAPAKFVSKNFEEAKVLISSENEIRKSDFDKLLLEIERLTCILDTKIENLSSEQLFHLYESKMRLEIVEKEISKTEIQKQVDELIETSWIEYTRKSL